MALVCLEESYFLFSRPRLFVFYKEHSLWLLGGSLTETVASGSLLPLMLMMRLQRVGRKNEPSYRVVVVDKRASTKTNKNIDNLGFYNPKLGVIEIDGEKAKQWLAQGVQASDTVHNMLVTKKIIEGKKINVLPKMTNRKPAEAAPVAA